MPRHLMEYRDQPGKTVTGKKRRKGQESQNPCGKPHMELIPKVEDIS